MWDAAVAACLPVFFLNRDCEGAASGAAGSRPGPSLALRSEASGSMTLEVAKEPLDLSRTPVAGSVD